MRKKGRETKKTYKERNRAETKGENIGRKERGEKKKRRKKEKRVINK